MKKLLTVLTFGLTLALTQPVLSHEEKPRHGGVVSEAKELSFELVNQDGKAVIYILDHGQPVDTAKASGKLTVLNGSEKTEADLQPAGENRLVSVSSVPLGKGAKAIASLTLSQNKVSVRFTVK
ncbi:MAG TPA: hypothetical protein VFV43_02010 [Limnobacter sp.]|nr:hypothetical protein [Limnobacter sp.]